MKRADIMTAMDILAPSYLDEKQDKTIRRSVLEVLAYLEGLLDDYSAEDEDEAEEGGEDAWLDSYW